MKRVIRLTEQDLAKVLSDVLNMTGLSGKNKEKEKTSDIGVSDEKIPNRTTSDDEFYKKVLKCLDL